MFIPDLSNFVVRPAGFEPRLKDSGISLALNTALSGTSPEGSACADLARILLC